MAEPERKKSKILLYVLKKCIITVQCADPLDLEKAQTKTKLKLDFKFSNKVSAMNFCLIYQARILVACTQHCGACSYLKYHKDSGRCSTLI